MADRRTPHARPLRGPRPSGGGAADPRLEPRRLVRGRPGRPGGDGPALLRAQPDREDPGVSGAAGDRRPFVLARHLRRPGLLARRRRERSRRAGGRGVRDRSLAAELLVPAQPRRPPGRAGAARLQGLPRAGARLALPGALASRAAPRSSGGRRARAPSARGVPAARGGRPRVGTRLDDLLPDARPAPLPARRRARRTARARAWPRPSASAASSTSGRTPPTWPTRRRPCSAGCARSCRRSANCAAPDGSRCGRSAACVRPGKTPHELRPGALAARVLAGPRPAHVPGGAAAPLRERAALRARPGDLRLLLRLARALLVGRDARLPAEAAEPGTEGVLLRGGGALLRVRRLRDRAEAPERPGGRAHGPAHLRRRPRDLAAPGGRAARGHLGRRLPLARALVVAEHPRRVDRAADRVHLPRGPAAARAHPRAAAAVADGCRPAHRPVPRVHPVRGDGPHPGLVPGARPRAPDAQRGHRHAGGGGA